MSRMIRRVSPPGMTWRVSAYYANDVEPPKQPGALAMTVELGTDWQKDLEVQVFESRPDIGTVAVEWIGQQDDG